MISRGGNVTRDVARVFWISAGLVSLFLGIVGILLPLIPGTPFVILAGFCFSKGSTRMHAWLLRQPYVGQMITDWDRYGTISPRAKTLAILTMSLGMGVSLRFTEVSLWSKGLVFGLGVIGAIYVLSRPSRH